MRCEGIIESGLLHRHEILSLVGAELRLAAADRVGQVAEHQVGLARQLPLADLAGGLAQQAHLLDVLPDVELVGAGAHLHHSHYKGTKNILDYQIFLELFSSFLC